MEKLVCYTRVSTRKQGDSGLGLESQEIAAQQHAKTSGGKIIASYVEIESGKRHDDRPELQKAIDHARSARATLLVARLDRLSRDAAFLLTLSNSGLAIRCCDMPDANALVFGIMASVAQWERERISERTRAALAVAKTRGKLLGSARPDAWQGREHRRRAGLDKAVRKAAIVRTQAAAESNAMALRIISAMRADGRTWQSIADELNAQGHVSRRGNPWTPQSVCQLSKGDQRRRAVA